ncbi:MAG TPA: type II toxin-antitoxin system VapC family toxin [Burkholderiaceae bacterium]|nr:type II toxin-antitoxin system VapC family toxin [Burkholderiaceae bacterium]HMY99483.1 type II toxin-antitoxin system VapC family toxin [Burkholderiaceae bacterium]HNB44032.1 type II toxin-antitoxin system VapC family toxin [Burkholderiaceae bacterium]HNG79226.1 type II toxin-antitoxin system VapC family toxin [Burkholderiaceae bacterium]
MRRAYLDACLLIHLVEGGHPPALAARRWVSRQSDVQLCVSPLVRLEVLVKPLRSGDSLRVQAYEQALAGQLWLSIDDAVFARALNLRSEHGLKTRDALHLATALQHGYTEFWTNDNRLTNAAGALAVNVLEAPA